MRRTVLIGGILAVAACITAAPKVSADVPPLTLRLEPGVAVPLTHPQSDRFGAGGDFVLKPTIGIVPWLDAGPVFSVLSLPSRLGGIDAGTALGLGAGFRVKRPHDGSNTGTGFKALSPWLDADVQYTSTGPLNRAALSLAVGASVPTGADRLLWIGPFVRYTDIVQDKGHVGFDNADAHVLIAGISFELGARARNVEPEPVAPPPPAPTIVVPPPPVVVTPPPRPRPPPEPVIITLREKIQFPYDSAIPLPSAHHALASALRVITAHPGWKVEIQGHASSEGSVVHNDSLSNRRARAVASFLMKHGVAGGRLTVRGFGPRIPVATNMTEVGRAANRRVEFDIDCVLTNEGGSK